MGSRERVLNSSRVHLRRGARLSPPLEQHTASFVNLHCDASWRDGMDYWQPDADGELLGAAVFAEMYLQIYKSLGSDGWSERPQPSDHASTDGGGTRGSDTSFFDKKQGVMHFEEHNHCFSANSRNFLASEHSLEHFWASDSG